MADVDVGAQPAPKMARSKWAGKKVLLQVNGSRGDVQPFIAFAQALVQAGFIVKFGTNVDTLAFVKQFGLDAVETAPDTAKVLETELARQMIAKGDFQKFMQLCAVEGKKHGAKHFAQRVELVQNFKPDIMIITPGYWAFGTFVMKLVYDSLKEASADIMLQQLPAIKPHMTQSLREMMLRCMHPISPVLIGYSPSLCHILDDWPQDLKDYSNITGFWVVSKEEQTRRLQNQDSFFGGSSLGTLKEFLGKGDAPVYMGWGSMLAVSPEHMTCLAVRALMKSQSRGIVLGGYAKLEAGMMQAQPDTPQMVAYAEENVLFLSTAPHEWLFPQCVCTVHHGGSGTVAAALRAGKPTIVTPCFADQFDNAKAVANAGVGIEMKQFSKVTADALARAICRAKAPEMLKAARDMGDKMRAEDGLGNAVKILDNWITDEVVTGRYKEKYEAQVKMVQQMRAQREPSCFWWLGRLCCSGDAANNYKIE